MKGLVFFIYLYFIEVDDSLVITTLKTLNLPYSILFCRDSEKLPSCKKPDPLSPVKDNIQLTPETEEDIFNKSECTRVQRAIFQ